MSRIPLLATLMSRLLLIALFLIPCSMETASVGVESAPSSADVWASRLNSEIKPILQLPEPVRTEISNLCHRVKFLPTVSGREFLEDALQLARQHLEADHYQLRHLEVLAEAVKWSESLDASDKARLTGTMSRYKAAIPLQLDGSYVEVLENLDFAAASLRDMQAPPFQEQIRLECERAFALARTGRAQQSRATALTACKLSDDWYGEIAGTTDHTLIAVADADLFLGEYLDALRFACRACWVREAVGASSRTPRCYPVIETAAILSLCGEYERAIEALNHIDQNELKSSKPLLARAKSIEGWIFLQRGEFERAIQVAKELQSLRLDYAQEAGADTLEALARLGIGELDAADRLVSETADTRTEMNVVWLRQNANEGIAELRLKQGRFQEAAELFERTLDNRRTCFGEEHPILLETLRLYSEALRKSDLATHADAIDKRREAIEQKMAAVRKQISGDRNCILPWEVAVTPGSKST